MMRNTHYFHLCVAFLVFHRQYFVYLQRLDYCFFCTKNIEMLLSQVSFAIAECERKLDRHNISCTFASYVNLAYSEAFTAKQDDTDVIFAVCSFGFCTELML